MRGVKVTLAIAAILLIAGLAVFMTVYNQEGFTGERTKNPDSYILDIQSMNGSDSHALNLTDGDVLQVEFETEKGSLHMEITAADGTILYVGNGENAKSFEIKISETGAYNITVKARHAKGKLNIRTKEKTK